MSSIKPGSKSPKRGTPGVVGRPRTLTSAVIDHLREAIIDGKIELGSLISEKVMAEEIGTSKTPVREALLRLQSVGLVEVLPQRGAIVFQPTLEQIRELCEVRLDLESLAFKHAMERNRSALADHLTDIVARMNKHFDVKNPLAYQRLDNEFHLAFFTHSGNTLLTATYELFYPRICALRTNASSHHSYVLNRSLEEHKEFLVFIKKGDVSSALLMLRDHIIRTRDSYSKLWADREIARLAVLPEQLQDRK